MALRRAYDSFQSAAHELCAERWRQGHPERCDVYACGSADENFHDDVLVGSFRTPDLASEAVAAHNERLARRSLVKSEIEDRRG